MTFSDRVKKYYGSRQMYETLHEDNPAVYLMFALCNSRVIADTIEQGRIIHEDLKKGILHEFPDYDTEEVTKHEHYVRTGKLEHDMTELAKGGETIGDLLYRLFKPVWNLTTKDLYDLIDEKTLELIEIIKSIDTAMHEADSAIFEDNFIKLMNRYDWTETGRDYQKKKNRHCMTMEWLKEQQEQELQKALELDIMHYEDEPSAQHLESVDYQYHRGLLPCDFKDSLDYRKAYAKMMHYATRKDELICFDYKNYGKYIALNLYKFRPEQQVALYRLIYSLNLIHRDMAVLKPELVRLLGMDRENEGTLEDTKYFAPYFYIKEMLGGTWFRKLRAEAKYDGDWADAFAEALIRSEYGEQIADDWKEKGNRTKGYVLGCLKGAGVFKKGISNDHIARDAGIMSNTRSFGKYIGKESQDQPYAEWIKSHVGDYCRKG